MTFAPGLAGLFQSIDEVDGFVGKLTASLAGRSRTQGAESA